MQHAPEDGAEVELRTLLPKFKYIRIGLNEDQIGSLDIPENPEKPGTYQWEALNDEQAGQMILKAIEPYWSKDGIDIIEEKENIVGKKWTAYVNKNRKTIARKLI